MSDLHLRRLETPLSGPRKERIEVLDEGRDSRAASVLGLLNDAYVPVLRELSYRLRAVGIEGRGRT